MPPTWGASRAISNAITEFPYFTGLYADLHAHGINVPISLCVLAICLSFARDPHPESRLELAGGAASRHGSSAPGIGAT